MLEVILSGLKVHSGEVRGGSCTPCSENDSREVLFPRFTHSMTNETLSTGNIATSVMELLAVMRMRMIVNTLLEDGCKKFFHRHFAKKKSFRDERLEEDCIQQKRNPVFLAAKKFPFLGASESSEEIKSLTWS